MKPNKCIPIQHLPEAIIWHQRQGKIIPITPSDRSNDIEEKYRIPIHRCREIMCANGLEYTDEELRQARDFLYQLASIADIQIRQTAQEPTIIPLTHNYEESHYLRTG